MFLRNLYPLAPRNSASARAWRAFLFVFATVLFLGSCDKPVVTRDTSSIVIEREVVLHGLTGDPESITQTTDGGFLITGTLRNAWAVRTDSAGTVLWKYQEPDDPDWVGPIESTLGGAVQLPDGSLLMCGDAKSLKTYYAGLIVALDKSGKVIEHQLVRPNNDYQYRVGSFNRCVAWGNGYAMAGLGSDGKDSRLPFGEVVKNQYWYWLVRFDGNRALQWEKLDNATPGRDLEVMADGSLVVAGDFGWMDGAGKIDGPRLALYDQSGRVLARRSTNFGRAWLMRSVRPMSTVSYLAVGKHNSLRLFTMDGTFKDIGKEKSVNAVDIHDGCGYVLPDGSIALFGAAAGSRSAVGWVNRAGKPDQVRAMPVPDVSYETLSIRDAVPIADNRFVTIRTQVSNRDIGWVMSWIALK